MDQEQEDEKEPNLIDSPLSQDFTKDGITVRVEIYKGDEPGWLLEVIDEHNSSIVWDELFKTDQAAWKEFLRSVKEEGLAAIVTGHEHPGDQ